MWPLDVPKKIFLALQNIWIVHPYFKPWLKGGEGGQTIWRGVIYGQSLVIIRFCCMNVIPTFRRYSWLYLMSVFQIQPKKLSDKRITKFENAGVSNPDSILRGHHDSRKSNLIAEIRAICFERLEILLHTLDRERFGSW